MRTIVPITCALCIATSSRADPPPPEAPAAPSEPAPVTAPAPAPTPAPATPATPATAAQPANPVVAGTPAVTAPAKPRRHSRVPEIATTIVAGGVVIATVVSYWKWDQAQALRRSAQWDPSITVEEHNGHIEDAERWKKRTWILAGGTFVSAAVTAFMWMRNQDPSSFSVQPTGDGDGAAVSYSGRF
jgi:hypothetical protein